MDKEKIIEAPQHISLIAICTTAVFSQLISGRQKGALNRERERNNKC